MAKNSELQPAGAGPSEERSAIVCLDKRNRIISLDGEAEALFGVRSDEVRGHRVNALLTGYAGGRRPGAHLPRTFVLRARAEGGSRDVSVEVRATLLRVRSAVLRVLLISPKRTGQALRDCQRLSTIVAHDLRASVGGLLMSMELLRTLRARAGAHEDIDRTVAAATGALRHMDRLIQDLADAHALNVGAFPLQPEPIRPARLLQAALAASRPLVTRNVLDVRCAKGLPEVSADPHRIAQVISNLLSNAAKAAPPGSCIRVSVVRDGEFVRFSVEDCAGGLPRQFARQLARRAKRSPGRRCLGLMIARNIVDAHGGRIWSEKRGAVGMVCFSLPIPMPQSPRRH